MKVTDIFGNTIEITNREEATKQLLFLCGSPFKMPQGITIGEYHKDLYNKIMQL